VLGTRSDADRKKSEKAILRERRADVTCDNADSHDAMMDDILYTVLTSG
jgi:hypothetical protein